jgi:geranylgeranyl pyrophosphate synthase
LSEQQQGKKFRPTIVSLLARAIQQDGTDISSSPYLDKVLQLGQITEMIHVASLIHDDVLDEAAMRRGGDAVHALYTNKVLHFTAGIVTL